MSPPETKALLREEIRERMKRHRSGLPHASQEIVGHLLRLPQFLRAQTILFFSPLPSEPDLLPALASARAANRTILFPRIDSLGLTARTTDHPSLLPGPLGILQPAENTPVFPREKIDLILLPGIAFDPTTGARLGRGAGYFDRFLATLSPVCFRLATCFHFQLLDGIPQEAHDQAADAILTENGILFPPNLRPT